MPLPHVLLVAALGRLFVTAEPAPHEITNTDWRPRRRRATWTDARRRRYPMR